MCSLVMENPSHWKSSALKSRDLEEDAAANRVGGLVFPFNGRAHNIMTPKILQEVRKMDRRLREDMSLDELIRTLDADCIEGENQLSFTAIINYTYHPILFARSLVNFRSYFSKLCRNLPF